MVTDCLTPTAYCRKAIPLALASGRANDSENRVREAGMRRIFVAAALLAAASCGAKETSDVRAPVFNSESHLFLEEVEGEAAITWVKAQNERSLKVLQEDPRYQTYYDEALKIATSKERIPYGSIRNGYVYNFWQDDEHERGLWRRAKLADYANPAPKWETLLDIDALAKTENANWVYKGVDCLPPENTDCMISLSDGGKDASRLREFDLTKKAFVEGGFDLPEAKSDAVWESKDSLLVATNWGEGTLTESGYPFVVKRLKRGQKLADATELFRGAAQDVAASPIVLTDAAGKRWFGASRGETFFTASFHIFPEGGGAPMQLPIPLKSTPRGLYNDQLLFTLEEDWTPEGASVGFKSGDLLSIPWSGFLATGKVNAVSMVLRPTERQAIQGVSV